ncbi:MAG: hypothetical protein HC835_02675 [Oscillatoriales cyanobacterium RM2_1_1]|nr:hypothetical protein [Oscillatoriales cyanobacterium SM2_3_0]NJO44614.1 hypothetical protein [Oscillatoriales cyanobacterium RM2_1_1]
MKFLPYENFTVQSSEPLTAVVRRLEAQIEAPRIRWSFSRNHPPYAGKLSENGFEVRRIIHYRNSFLPRIRGQFEASSGGTKVRIRMDLHPLIIAFLLFWCSLWYSVTIPVFLLILLNLIQGPFWQGLMFVVIPTVMLPAIYFSFRYEADRSRRKLTNIILGNSP